MLNKVKVFSATKAKDRDALGDRVTRYLRDHSSERVLDHIVTQSSDREFHCLVIVLLLQTGRAP
jgi:hypothetical protein